MKIFFRVDGRNDFKIILHGTARSLPAAGRLERISEYISNNPWQRDKKNLGYENQLD